MQNNVNYLPKRRCKGLISILVSDRCTSREKTTWSWQLGWFFDEVQLHSYTRSRWEKAIKGKQQSDSPHTISFINTSSSLQFLCMTIDDNIFGIYSENIIKHAVCMQTELMFQLVGTSFKCFGPTFELIHNL